MENIEKAEMRSLGAAGCILGNSQQINNRDTYRPKRKTWKI
jgi:hypothetical protein